MHISYVQRRDKISMKTNVVVQNMARNVVNLTSNVLKSSSCVLNDPVSSPRSAILALAKCKIIVIHNIL